jgi:hypothetical protein
MELRTMEAVQEEAAPHSGRHGKRCHPRPLQRIGTPDVD